MQLTRSGHSRWRPSQLILVFAGLRTRATNRLLVAISLAAAVVACGAHTAPAISPERSAVSEGSPQYVEGPGSLRFRSGTYVIPAGCKGRCTAIGDEWTADVNCPEGPVSLTAPNPTPAYVNPVRVTLATGATVTSGTISRGGLRAFCATVGAQTGAETACTVVASESARARVTELVLSFDASRAELPQIECHRFKGM